MLADGLNAKAIALELHLSSWTIYTQISTITRRFRSNGYNLVYLAVKKGCIKDVQNQTQATDKG